MHTRMPFVAVAAFLLCSQTVLGADLVWNLVDKPADWTVTGQVAPSAEGLVLNGGASLTWTAPVDAGLFELTISGYGNGFLDISARGEGLRAVRRLKLVGESGVYGLLFETTGLEATLEFSVSVDGAQAKLAAAAVKPATMAQREAWQAARESWVMLGYYGIDPQRPAPGTAPVFSATLTPEILARHAIVEPVVFQDPDYDSHWVDDPSGVARWFVRRGFARKNVAELSAWLTGKVEANEAIGTSVVFAMGVAPTSIVHSPYDDCLLSRYVEAGGRVVWLSNVPMYVAQDDVGPKIIYGEEPQRQMLGLSTDRRTFYGVEGSTLTQTGQWWGLEPANSLTRPVMNRGLTACFFSDPTNEYCGVGLVNLRPDAPLSGFIFMPDPIAPSKEALLRNAYRLAVWSGFPITIPAPSALEIEALPFSASLRFGEDDVRSTFVRGDVVPIYVRLESHGPLPLDASAILTVDDRNTNLTKSVFLLEAPTQEADVFLDEVDLSGLRRDAYKVSVTVVPGMTVGLDFDPRTALVPDALTLTRDIRVAPIPDHEGTHVALWTSASPSQRRTSHLLDWLDEHDIEPHFTDDYAIGRDLAQWYGMSFSVRRHGESANAPAPPGHALSGSRWRR